MSRRVKPQTEQESGPLPPPLTPVEENGPTRVTPIPPPPLPPNGEEPVKRRVGRPLGSKNGDGAKKKTIKPIVGLDELKAEMVKGSALLSKMAEETKWAPLADSFGWHEFVKVRNEKGDEVTALTASGRLNMATELLGPYLEESGALSAASLSNEGKAAIGIAILVGPAFLAGFGMLWEWAWRKPPAKERTIEVTRPCAGNPHCFMQDGFLRHATDCPRSTSRDGKAPEGANA